MAEEHPKYQTLKPGHLFLTGQPGVGKSSIVINTINSVLQSPLPDVRVRGFYTEERREQGERIGFDIVHWPSTVCKPGEGMENIKLERAPLARIGKAKKGESVVGKYLVNVENVARCAVPSIKSNSRDDDGNTEAYTDLVVIDEVGKMELLCPTFFQTVKSVLDSSEFGDDGDGVRTEKEIGSPKPQRGKRQRRTIVFGTIPMPRYGRVIPSVESLRARSDVTVLHVTKSNRDELREEVKRVMLSFLRHPPIEGKDVMKEELSDFVYDKPIDATYGNPATVSGTVATKRSNRQSSSSARPSSSSLNPCGPILSETVPPRVLLLGETASPQPSQSGMEYSERSMWTVLGAMFGLSGSACNFNGDEGRLRYEELGNVVRGASIGIWDVLSDVHDKKVGSKRRRGKGNPNDIESLLCQRPSVVCLAFIGQKARQTFGKHFALSGSDDHEILLASRRVKLVVLPSSSPANSGMTVVEKGREWRAILSEFCPKLRD